MTDELELSPLDDDDEPLMEPQKRPDPLADDPSEELKPITPSLDPFGLADTGPFDNPAPSAPANNPLGSQPTLTPLGSPDPLSAPNPLGAPSDPLGAPDPLATPNPLGAPDPLSATNQLTPLGGAPSDPLASPDPLAAPNPLGAPDPLGASNPFGAPNQLTPLGGAPNQLTPLGSPNPDTNPDPLSNPNPLGAPSDPLGGALSSASHAGPLSGPSGGGPLSGPSAGGPLGGPSQQMAPPPGKKGPKQPSKIGEFVKTSNFRLIMGSLGVIVMFVIAAVIISKQPQPNVIFASAETSFTAGDYGSALPFYTRVYEQFSSSPQASEAKIKASLCQLNLETEKKSGTDKEQFERLKALISLIQNETWHPSIQERLSKTLPPLTARLAASKNAQDLIVAREALELTRSYVPSDLFSSTTLDVDAVLVELTQREIEVKKEAAKTEAITKIKSLISEKKTEEGYEVINQLLRDFPRLDTSSALRAVAQQLVSTEIGSIKYSSETKSAHSPSTEDVIQKSILASSLVSTEPANETLTLFSAADGVSFAVNGLDGKLTWFSSTGYDTDFEPVALNDEISILANSSHGIVYAIETKTGLVKWRQKLDFIAGQPMIDGTKIHVSQTDGNIATIDGTNGSIIGNFQIPQPLNTGGVVDSSDFLIYQVGSHSNLYVLSTDSNSCVEVLYLGHKHGTIAAPPLVQENLVLIVENYSLTDSRLHVFTRSSSGRDLKRQKVIELNGHVFQTPVMVDDSVFVSTTSGSIQTFKYAKNSSSNPITKGPLSPPLTSGIAPNLIISEEKLFAAAEGIVVFDLPPGGTNFLPSQSFLKEYYFLQPPLKRNSLLVAVGVHHETQQTGIVGLDAKDLTNHWKFNLPAAPIGNPISIKNGSSIGFINSAGEPFELTTGQLTSKETNLVETSLSENAEANSHVEVGTSTSSSSGTTVLSPGRNGTQISVKSGAGTWKSIVLPQPLSASAVALDNLVVLPQLNSSLILLNPETESFASNPVFPSALSASSTGWTLPAVSGKKIYTTDGGHLVLAYTAADGSLNSAGLYDSKHALVTPVTTVGSSLFVVDEQNHIVLLKADDLTETKRVPLPSGVCFGPVSIKDKVIIGLRNGQVAAFNATGDQAWVASIANSNLSGASDAKDGTILVATENGTLAKISLAEGKASEYVSSMLDIVGNPLMIGQQAVVLDSSGLVYLVKAPK